VAGHCATSAPLLPQGGPTVPCTILYVVESVPVEVVVASALVEGAEHPTDTVELTGAGSATVGCFGSALHSNMLPGDPAVNPLPVTLTVCMLTRPLSGLTSKAAVGFFVAEVVVVVEAALLDELLAQAPSPTASPTVSPTASPTATIVALNLM